MAAERSTVRRESGREAALGLSIAEVEAQAGTPLILAIKVGEEARPATPADQMLWANTILGVLGPRERIHEWAQQQGLRVLPKTRNFGAMFNPTRAGISGAVIPPNSRFIGQRVGELRLRKRYGISVLAVNRGDKIWRDEIRGRMLRQGDTLVFHGAWRDLAHAAEDHDFVVVTDYPKDEERPHRLNHAIVFFALSMVLALLSDLPLPVALLSGGCHATVHLSCGEPARLGSGADQPADGGRRAAHGAGAGNGGERFGPGGAEGASRPGSRGVARGGGAA